MYRPFAILEEEKGEKKSRIQKMREKIGNNEIYFVNFAVIGNMVALFITFQSY